MSRQKLNVGVFTHDFYPFVGGQGRHLYELYEQNQKEQAVNMIIFSPVANDAIGHVTLYPETAHSKLKNIEYSFKLHRDIRTLIKKYDLDIVHVHGGPGGLFFVRRVNVPVIFTSHHTYYQQSKYVRGQSWKRLFTIPERIGYKRSNRTICVSSGTSGILTDFYNLPKEKITVIPNGLNRETFLPVVDSKGNKDIVYQGRLDERKGILFLVQAMELVGAKDPDITLHVIGTGKLFGAIKSQVVELSLNVQLHGYLTDQGADAVIRKCCMQIVPSVFEGFGMTVLEGMARRIPVVATDVDGISDIIINGENGILIPYGNKQLLADSILTLIGNQNRRDDLANAAFAGLKKYNWGEIYQQTMGEYERVRA